MKQTHLSTKLTRAIALGVLFVPALAQAHPGHSTGLGAGVRHPFSGLDHMAAILAVGLWASQLGGRARFLVPLAFMAAIAVGGALGIAGAVVPGVEQGIAASMLILGLVVTVAGRLPVAAAMGLAGGFALFHGMAHGSEIPTGADAASYAVGFAASTLALIAGGLGLGTIAARLGQPIWVRLTGAGIAVAGVMSSAAAF